MSLFLCDAIDKTGKKVRLKRRTGSPQILKGLLRREGYFVLKITPAGNLPKKYSGLRHKVPERELVTFYRQVAIILRSGGRIDEALASLQNRKGFSGTFRKILRDIYLAILAGNSFSASLARHKKTFPLFFIKMAEVGENSSSLCSAMENMADYSDRMSKIKREVNGATVYPKFLAVSIVAVIAYIFTAILPILEKSVSPSAELPEATRFAFACSKFMRENILYFIAGAAAVAFTAFAFSNTTPGRSAIGALKLYFPIGSDIYRALIASYFSNAFYLLYSGGLTVTDSLDCICGMTNNIVFEKKLLRASVDVKCGRPIHVSIGRMRVFSSTLTELIRVGESCGGLTQALKSAGEAFEHEAISIAKRDANLLEPLLILIIGAVVLLVAFSVFLPTLAVLNAI